MRGSRCDSRPFSRQETARRLRHRIGAVLRWSIGAGHRTDNPAGEAISEALPKNGTAVRQHRRTPHHREVAGALAKIRASAAGTPTKLMLEYTILTATRSGESRLATWSEVDLQAGVWTIPAERMKSGREHRVPLSMPALELLTEAQKLSDGTGAVGDKMVGAVEGLSPQELAQLTDSSSRRSVLKQPNHNRVVQLALDRLTPETREKQQDPVSDEFLDTFEPIAENQRTEEMQALFARILAGEIQKPGSFSKRSLRMAEQLDRPTAELFQRLCSMALVRERFLVTSGGVTLLVAASQLSYSKIVCSLHGFATSNTLEEFGLDFTRLNRLAEYGLIIPSINMQQLFTSDTSFSRLSNRSLRLIMMGNR